MWIFWLLIYRIRPETLGERDTSTPSTLDADSRVSDSLEKVSTHSGSITTISSSQASHGDRLSQSSMPSSSNLSQQTLSQDVCMGDADESDDDIEDFDDDIIWWMDHSDGGMQLSKS